MSEEIPWRTQNFRQSVVKTIDKAIRKAGMSTTNSIVEMESYMFQKTKTMEEYLGFVARLILDVRKLSHKKKDKMNQAGGEYVNGIPGPLND